MSALKSLEKIPQAIEKKIDDIQYVDKSCKITSAVSTLLLLSACTSGRLERLLVWSKKASHLRTVTVLAMSIPSTYKLGLMLQSYRKQTEDETVKFPSVRLWALQINLVAFHWFRAGSGLTKFFGSTKSVGSLLGRPINLLVLMLDAQYILSTLLKRPENTKGRVANLLALTDDGLDFVSTGLDALDQTGAVSLGTAALSGACSIGARLVRSTQS